MRASTSVSNFIFGKPTTPAADFTDLVQPANGFGTTLSGPGDWQLSQQPISRQKEGEDAVDALVASRPGSSAGVRSRPTSTVGGRRVQQLDEAKPVVNMQPMFLQVRDQCASAVLKHLRIHDIVAFDGTSPGLREFCRSSQSGRLIVPILTLVRKQARQIDLSSVEEMFADDQRIITAQENEDFASLLSSCSTMQAMYCARNEHLIVASFTGALRCMQQLRLLDLSGCQVAADDRFKFRKDQPLEEFFVTLPPMLQFLDLSHNLLRDHHAVQLVAALESRCTNGACGLEHLSIKSNYFGNTAGQVFAKLMRSPAGVNLCVLDMRTNRVEALGATAMLGALRVHPRLKEIRIGYNTMNQEQDLETTKLACILLHKALSAKSANLLEVIDLNNVRIGDDGAGQLSLALLNNNLLRRLYLCFNSIGPDGARSLAGMLSENRTLQLLDLRDNEVGDEGAESLAYGLCGNYAMRRLLLARNEVGIAGAQALAKPVRDNPRLAVEFGASGADSQMLQSMVRHTPRRGFDWWSEEAQPMKWRPN